jgi:hypothetical protein
MGCPLTHASTLGVPRGRIKNNVECRLATSIIRQRHRSAPFLKLLTLWCAERWAAIENREQRILACRLVDNEGIPLCEGHIEVHGGGGEVVLECIRQSSHIAYRESVR